MDYGDYIIPFGKHRNKPLKELPKEYLVELYRHEDLMTKWPELKLYIEATYPLILPIPSLKSHEYKYEPIPCEKNAYVDEDAAKKALKLIKQDKRDHKKPNRAYQCEICGFWHLTSKPLTENIE
jgi:hypothetical protein